jgi:hypothetical protein
MSHHLDVTGHPVDLTSRALAVLRATRNGRVQVSLSCEPDVFIDGLAFCDQPGARDLVHAGLLSAVRPGRVGERVPARLTQAGDAVLTAAHSEPRRRSA